MYTTIQLEVGRLVDAVHDGTIRLPDFQRSFVWQPKNVRELFSSIMKSHPIGSLLWYMDNGLGQFPVPTRLVEGVANNQPVPQQYVVLDGQQRITSLYQAMKCTTPYNYYFDLDLLDNYLRTGNIDYEDCIIAVKHSGRNVRIQTNYISFGKLCEQIQLQRDIQQYALARYGDISRLDPVIKILLLIPKYQIPILALNQGTSLDSICAVFERINRAGVSLSPYDISVAKQYAQGVKLRSMWEKALASYSAFTKDDYNIDPYIILQVIAILSGKRSITNAAIFSLTAAEVNQHWNVTIQNLNTAIAFLRGSCGVILGKYLPYVPMLTTLTAVFASIGGNRILTNANTSDIIKKWFWQTVLSQYYESSTNTRILSDVDDLTDWINESQTPNRFTAAELPIISLSSITPRQSSLYKGILCLILSNNPGDFGSGNQINFTLFTQAIQVDDHHIFPKNYLKRRGITRNVDSILNRTLIDAVTNKAILNKAPSSYLVNVLGNNTAHLPNHYIDPQYLRSDDYRSFLSSREQLIIAELANII